ncbi:hypothetical protein EV685_0226 [Sphaerotilus mobilis]|uniref:G domain-containing protein n=1 Tax=Sphaerotilus mobilis TaxID=47994 RepID=A0A4Q7LUN9_9BURK|nr:hypothetical protein EV685_0226 [Sphaerotilus mobilis]
MTLGRSLLRRHWRLLVRLLAIVVPFLGLAGLGLWHLYLDDALLIWFAALAALAVIAWLATLDWSGERALQEATPPTPAKPEWTPLEQQAWADLTADFEAIESSPPASIEEVRLAAMRMMETAARRLHPDASVPTARFTVPDVLRAAERGLGDLRRQMVQRVPGATAVRVSDLLAVHGHYRRHGGWLRGAWYLWRVARFGMNPPQAALQELRGVLEGGATSAAWQRVHGQFARAMAEEFARLAIDLYGRRFSVEVEQLQAEIIEAAPEAPPEVPVRVSFFGQVNAGKSSLVNALLGEVQAPVSERRTPAGETEFRLQSEGRPDLVLIDTAGLGTDVSPTAEARAASDARWVAANAWACDLVVWVASAIQPAREDDHRLLSALRIEWATHPERRTPRVLCVVTHADRLSPMREWQPPYDLDGAASGKAASIRDACRAVATDLCESDEPVVPIAMRPGTAPYNVDALWLAISEGLDAARQSALHRALFDRTRFKWGEVARQVGQGSRYLGKLMFKGVGA